MIKKLCSKLTILLVVAIIAAWAVQTASANKIEDMLNLIEQINEQIAALEAQLEILKQIDPPPTDLILQLEIQILQLQLQKLKLELQIICLIDGLEVSIKIPPPQEVHALSTWVVEYYIYNSNDCEIDVAHELEPEQVHTSGAVVVIYDITEPEIWDYYSFGEKVTIMPGATQEFIISLSPPEGVAEFSPKVIMREYYTQEEFFSHEFTIQVIIPNFCGFVNDAQTEEALKATVMVINPKTRKAVKTISNEYNGYYEIFNLEPGDYLIICWKQYYKFTFATATLEPLEYVLNYFQLVPKE